MNDIQKPMIITGSARYDGDTSHYTDHVFKDIDVDIADLLNYNISLYNYKGIYPADDEFDALVNEILRHNVIVFATPVYWYAMSANMKIFFDRLTDLVTTNKKAGRALKNKTTFLLVVGTDDNLPDAFDTPFALTSRYMDMHYKGSIYFSTKERSISDEKDKEIQQFINRIKDALSL